MVKNVGSRSVRTTTGADMRGAGAMAFTLPATSAAVLSPATVGTVGLDAIGPKLGEMRRQSGMTQLDVAFKMGTTQPALARLEKGEAKANLRTLARYATALGQRARAQFADEGAGRRPKGPANSDGIATSARVFDIEDLPSTLAMLRKERGFTQSEVAARMETTQPVIANLENGSGLPNLTTLERYSQAIGGSLEISFEAARPTSSRV
jgi:transcriptional regulator with XRE-family HTH domain